MTTYRAVILDIDGTLVNSNDAHARAWVDALAEHNLHVPFDVVRPLIGMGGDKLLPRVSGIEEESGRGQRIAARRSEIFRARYLPGLRAFDQAHALLARMHADGYTLAVATSAKKEEVDPLLALAGAHELLQSKTSSDDAENSKPDPDIIHAALRRAGVPAAAAIMLGDTPYDIAAAARAGVATIALRCGGGWTDADLADAVAIYDSPADLLARYDDSPLGRHASGRPSRPRMTARAGA